MVHHCQDTIDCISEEVLGFGRELPEASYRSGEPSPCPSPVDFWASERKAVATDEQLCPEVAAGKLLCIVHYGRIRRSTPYSRKET